MTDKNYIEQENGSDWSLAIAYGELLDGKLSESEINDPFFGILNSAKQEHLRIESSIDIHGKEIAWNRLLTEMESSSANEKRRNGILRMNTGRTWFRAAAAVLLIATTALLTFMLTRPAESVLLASADSVIRVVELRDGSAVTLRPNSSLYEVSYSDDHHLFRLEGEAFFDVQSNPSREFQVNAGTGEVTVLGTRFNLYEREGNSRVDLIEGNVRFRNTETSDEVMLKPGEAAEISESISMSGPVVIDSDEVTGWTRNRLTFRDRQMSEIIEELEFHYSIRITAPDSVLIEALGGSVPLDNAEQTLRDLGLVLGGEFRETESGQFEFRQK